jgi:hypothetical protein
MSIHAPLFHFFQVSLPRLESFLLGGYSYCKEGSLEWPITLFVSRETAQYLARCRGLYKIIIGPGSSSSPLMVVCTFNFEDEVPIHGTG